MIFSRYVSLPLLPRVVGYTPIATVDVAVTLRTSTFA